MKIGLLTIWHEKNYGAELQAYATISVLRNMGHDVSLIDIRLTDIERVSIKSRIGKILTFFCPSNIKFNLYWGKYIPKTKHYKSYSDIDNFEEDFDCIIVGSDQVWNPLITKEYANIFFLDFASSNIKKISYASSFGCDEWPNELDRVKVKELLNNFLYVSCREQSGCEILKKELDISSACVVDPTLLLADYRHLIKGKLTNKKTLVFYPLYDDPELKDFSIKVAHILNLTFVDNMNLTLLFNRIEWNRNSIGQWIKNIAESEFVITRSFHGLVFSLLFGKKFAIVSGDPKRSCRVTNLLNRIGLMDRFYLNVESLERDKPWNRDIDYKAVNSVINTLRAESLDFLNKALSV